MPNTTEMLTLAQMLKTPSAELRSIALHTRSRMYAIACNQMADALDESRLSGRVTDIAKAHIAKASDAHLQARKDEHAQVMSAQRKRVQLAADGIKPTCAVV
jgi:glutamine synthetase adenylyltransferase